MEGLSNRHRGILVPTLCFEFPREKRSINNPRGTIELHCMIQLGLPHSVEVDAVVAASECVVSLRVELFKGQVKLWSIQCVVRSNKGDGY